MGISRYHLVVIEFDRVWLQYQWSPDIFKAGNVVDFAYFKMFTKLQHSRVLSPV